MRRFSSSSICCPEAPGPEPPGSGIAGCTSQTQAGPLGRGAFAQHGQNRMRLPVHRNGGAGELGVHCIAVHPWMYCKYCL